MSAAEPRILDALCERLLAAGEPLSAALLAQQFGWSLAQLSASVASLRKLGAMIETTASGYTLQLDDALDANLIRTRLPAASRLVVAVKRVCNSTNHAVRALLLPALCATEVQLGGRGRRGRQWMQPFGAGLMMSLSAAIPKGRLDALAIALSIASLEYLDGMGLSGARMKWPNDLMLGDAKLGGLMIEADGGSQARLCIGLGINVSAAPMLPDRGTAALIELGQPLSRNALAAGLAQTFMEALERYDAEGFAPFAAKFPRYDWLANQQVTVYGVGEAMTGIARGIDDCGALILETAQGRKLCRAGEASLSAPAKVAC